MSYNDITGDRIATKSISDKYRDNYDKIFNKRLDQIKKAEEFSKTTPDELIQQIRVMAKEVEEISKSSKNYVLFRPEQFDMSQNELDGFQEGILMSSECDNTGKIIDQYDKEWSCRYTKESK